MKVISGGQFLHVKLIYIDKVNEDELGLRLSPYKSSLGTLFGPPPPFCLSLLPSSFLVLGRLMQICKKQNDI